MGGLLKTWGTKKVDNVVGGGGPSLLLNSVFIFMSQGKVNNSRVNTLHKVLDVSFNVDRCPS